MQGRNLHLAAPGHGGAPPAKRPHARGTQRHRRHGRHVKGQSYLENVIEDDGGEDAFLRHDVVPTNVGKVRSASYSSRSAKLDSHAWSQEGLRRYFSCLDSPAHVQSHVGSSAVVLPCLKPNRDYPGLPQANPSAVIRHIRSPPHVVALLPCSKLSSRKLTLPSRWAHAPPLPRARSCEAALQRAPSAALPLQLRPALLFPTPETPWGPPWRLPPGYSCPAKHTRP